MYRGKGVALTCRGHDEYEALSAYHKELRRGDAPRALYWLHELTNEGRKKYFMLRYTYQVVFEETWNYRLGMLWGDLLRRGARDVSYEELQEAVIRFCESPKKWELGQAVKVMQDWRKVLFLVAKHKRENFKIGTVHSDEIRAKWERYGTQFGRVGIFSGPEFMGCLEEAVIHKNMEKALYLITYFEHSDHRMNELLEDLQDVVLEHGDREAILFMDENLLPNKGSVDNYEVQFLLDYMINGYDASFERPEKPIDRAEAMQHFMVHWKTGLDIPKYAIDRHTRRGKAIITKNPPRPGQPYPLDLRYTGDWIGMAWRWKAMEQFGTIDVPWEDVEWEPREYERYAVPIG